MIDSDWFDEFSWLEIGIAGAIIDETIDDDEKEIKKIEKDFDDDDLDQDDDYA